MILFNEIIEPQYYRVLQNAEAAAACIIDNYLFNDLI